MANFRTTADYLDSILLLAGEVTNGNSPYETRTIHYLNRIHNAIICGGTEFNVEVDEIWPWALSKDPIIIELQPKYETGTIAFTDGSTAGTFSSAPSISLAGYHVFPSGSDQVYRIVTHSSGATAFTIDSPYPGSTASGISFTAAKLDYELVPQSIPITTENNKIAFSETSGTELTATLSVGSYTPGDLATEVKTQLDSSGASTYTVTYDSITRDFTITSDGTGGGNIFSILGSTGSAANTYSSALPSLGFGLADQTGALTYTSERALGSIVKMTQPMALHTEKGKTKEVYGINPLRFQEEFPIAGLQEGNPNRFTIIEERPDGYVKVRFNRYVESARRIYVNYVPQPLRLADTSKSTPLIPDKYSQVLEYGAAAYLLAEKNDSRAPQYFQMAGQVLEAMVKFHRKDSQRANPNFGDIVPREDLRENTARRRLKYGYYSEDF